MRWAAKKSGPMALAFFIGIAFSSMGNSDSKKKALQDTARLQTSAQSDDIGKANNERATEQWYQDTAEAVLHRVDSTPAGLSTDEAQSRLSKNGPNALRETKGISPWSIFLRQFQSLLVWILLAAGFVSGFVGDTVDTVAIFAIVALNAIMGFYQEWTAERSIAALKKMTAPQAKVARGGTIVMIPAIEIVSGDVVYLEAGDIVAADARLLSVAALKCMESALTGESEPTTKTMAIPQENDLPIGDRNNLVFMGTQVAAGAGQAVVVATGMQTELGKIAELLQQAEPRKSTALQLQLDTLGRLLIIATVGIIALLFVVGLQRGVPSLELFMSSISLAVAAVPEGLPTVVTVALALGVHRMARRRALVRKLSAVETLGSTSVICTDKTGTLTAGQMTVRTLYVAGKEYQVTGQGYATDGQVQLEGKTVSIQSDAGLRQLSFILVGCNSAHLVQKENLWQAVGNPTELALLIAGMKAGLSQAQLELDAPKHAELPFESDRKRGSVLRSMPDGLLRSFTNGAPGGLLQQSSKLYHPNGNVDLTDELRASILGVTSKMASQALRVLGSAYRDLPSDVHEKLEPGELDPQSIERDMVFVGLAGMYDPPRPEAMGALARCRGAGIRVIMITGDHPETAVAIAKELKLDSQVAAVTGAELDRMSDAELTERSRNSSVYARVTAKNKLRIVRELQRSGDIVAMTGDGVNDAPAIQGADIGIAMGKAGTEVTKQASDIIITDDNFATIVAAIEEGRGIYENIRKTLQYLLAGNTGELLLMLICVIIGLPAPLMPIHLLWINLVTDGLPALCLATDNNHSDSMKCGPRKAGEQLTNASFVWTMIVTGFLTAGVTLVVFVDTLRTSDIEHARASAFTVLVFAELMRALGARSSHLPVWKIKPIVNWYLFALICASIATQLLSLQTPMLGSFLKTPYATPESCLVLFAVGCIPMLVLEMTKVMLPSKHASSNEVLGA